MTRHTALMAEREEGGKAVTCPALLGCISEGHGCQEPLHSMTDAIQLYVRAVANDIHPIPQRETHRLAQVLPRRPPCRGLAAGRLSHTIWLAGFKVLSQSGSHLYLRPCTGAHRTERITVPVHTLDTRNLKAFAHLKSVLRKEMPMGH